MRIRNTWTAYMNHIIPDSPEIFLADIRDYDFERQCLPMIQEVKSLFREFLL